jgi:hypothetical protein
MMKSLGSTLMLIGSLGGLILGILVATGAAGQAIYAFKAGSKGAIAVWLTVLPFLVVILVASFMLSGQEQFTEE